MPGPSLSTRGTADRALQNRYESPLERTALTSTVFWNLIGDEAIPAALADGLASQRRFDDAVATGDLELANLLAQRLLADREFLRGAAQRAPRAADGALLAPDGQQATVWAPRGAAPPAGYPTRPRELEEIPPFFPANVREWTDARDGGGPRLAPIANPRPRRPLDPKAAQAALQGALETLRRRLIDLDVASITSGDTPIIDRSRANLAALTLRDISTQTHVPFIDRPEPLLDDTQLFLFHGAYFSVALDHSGEPTVLEVPKIGPLLRAPILVPEGGHPMRRYVPSPGLYLSVQKYGFSTFKIDGSSISKVLFGGVGGFQEVFLAGITDLHPLHQTIQAYLEHLPAPLVYVGGISLESVANPTPITAQLIHDKVPDIAMLAVPHAVARLKATVTIEGLEEIAVEVIEQVVVQVVLRRVIEFVVERIATKLIPVVNVAFAVYDVVSLAWYGAEKVKRIVDGIAALALALGGKTRDEDTIAAKVLGRLMADEFREDVVQALTALAAKHADRAGRKAPVDHPAPVGPEESAPVVEPPAPPATPVPAPQTPAPPVHAPLPQVVPHPGAAVAPPPHPNAPPGIVAGGMHGAIEAHPPPPPPLPETHASADKGVADPATSATSTGETAARPAQQETAAGAVTAEPPSAATTPATPAAPAATRGVEHRGEESTATEEAGTRDSAITQSDVSRIGVHDRSPDPLRTQRGLHDDRPEHGTPMGFQTQIGPELATAIGRPGHEVPVTSRNPDVLISADTIRHRKDVLKIIGRDDAHPMRPIYDPETEDFLVPPYKLRGEPGDLQLWQQHPYDWEAGHARSKKVGDAEVIVFQTRFRNQEQSGLLERTGDVTKDEVFVIGGIAIEKRSAWDLFAAGYLSLTLDQMKALPTLKL